MKIASQLFYLVILIVILLADSINPSFSIIKPADKATYNILVNVNGTNIFSADLNTRIKINNLFTPALNNNTTTIKKTILDQLITETLIINDSKRYNLTATAEDINEEVREIEAINKWSLNTFNQKIKAANINQADIKSYLYAQALIKKMIDAISAQYINISNEEVDNSYYNLLGLNGKTKYLLKEIYISRAQRSDKEALEAINNVYQQLQRKANFGNLAAKYSDSYYDRVHKGDIGWIYETEISSDIKSALDTIPKGKFTKPLLAVNGYYIYLLQDKQPIVYFEPSDLSTTTEVKNMLKQQLITGKTRVAVDNYIKNLYSKAVITYNVK